MGRIVIVAYRPKPGRAEELLQLVREHVPALQAEGLATDRPAGIMLARDGTVVEVFEWVSEEAIQKAHTNPAVHRLWQRFGELCDCVPLNSLAEVSQTFATFEAV